MSTYLLTYSEKKWKWDSKDIDMRIAKIAEKGFWRGNWTCGVNKHIRRGDSFYMLRQGKEPRGIFASGEIIKDCYIEGDENWVGIKWHHLLNPERDKILSVDVLERIGINWRTQASGTLIPDEILPALNAAWNQLIDKHEKPNYWLFQIMPRFFPELWQTSVKMGIAAQHYPRGWTNEKPNTRDLKKIRKGDFVVAALQQFRFAGYGEIMSDFYRGGPPLKFGDGETFEERFKCTWKAMPEDNFVKCADLGSAVRLTRGRCVKQIDGETFIELKNRLDEAGAKYSVPNLDEIIKSDEDAKKYEDEEFREGGKKERFSSYYERDHGLKAATIKYHGVTCAVCEFNFGDYYGQRGSNYIEVHHLKPVSTLKKKEKVNPKEDMAVLCSNCHRMIHRKKDDILSVDELKKLSLETEVNNFIGRVR